MKITGYWSLFFVTVLLSSCLIKSPSRHNAEILLAGKGEWNIDEFRVCKLYQPTSMIVYDTTYYDYGYLKFSGNRKEVTYEMENIIPLEFTEVGPISGPAEVLGSDIILHLGYGAGLDASYIDAQIVKIDRNEVILFCPWTLNTIFEYQQDNFDFYFKLSKK